ncbi:MAG: hypothetical protein QOI21_3229 [Actinomycetota bacterium]|nr:hypothetical protein [Actinomycetota bacterium]
MGTVELELHGATAWLTMARPPDNKLDLELTRLLSARLAECDADARVAAIVLTGAGDVFCGGADTPEISRSGTLHEFADAIVELFASLAEIGTPVIAAVNGDALAGGFGLLCSAHLVLAVENARIGTIEARYGSWPVVAQVAALRRTPLPVLVANALTGEPLSATQAADNGIVNEVVRAEDLRGRAAELAAAVTRGGAAIPLGLPELYRAARLPYREALRRGADQFVRLAER